MSRPRPEELNGVASFEAPVGGRRGLPGDDGDDHSRYIEAVIPACARVRLASIYLPNGNPVGTEKYPYKLAWMDRLPARGSCWPSRSRLSWRAIQRHPRPPDATTRSYGPATRCSARDPAANFGSWCPRPHRRLAREERQRRSVYVLGLPGGAWPRNNGIRIDHFCSRRRPPTSYASDDRSTRRCGAATGPPTIRRSAWSLRREGRGPIRLKPIVYGRRFHYAMFL